MLQPQLAVPLIAGRRRTPPPPPTHPPTFITAASRQWPARQVQKQKSARFMGISLQAAGDLQSVTGRRWRSDAAGVSLLSQEVKERQIEAERPPSPPGQYQINKTSVSFLSFFFFLK